MTHIISESDDGYIVDTEAELVSENFDTPEAQPVEARPAPSHPVLFPIKGDKGDPGVPGPPGGEAPAVVAGEAIGGHRLVILDGLGHAFYADNTDPTHIGRVYGVTYNAAALGGDLRVVRSGYMEEPSWAWEPGLPVFVGQAGALTQQQPVTGFSQIVGVPSSPTSLLIQFREPLSIV